MITTTQRLYSHLALWVMMCISLTAHAQTNNKLAPTLQAVVCATAPALTPCKAHAPLPTPYLTTNQTHWYSVLIYGYDLQQLKEQNITQITLRTVQQNRFATALATAEGLRLLAQNDHVRYVLPATKTQPLDDEANGWAGIDLLQKGLLNNTNYNGTGVIVGIIDTGTDYTQTELRRPTDSITRIIAIWDQNLNKIGTELTPQNRNPALTGMNYGVEYTSTELNNELDGTPANFVRHIDSGHGTAVTGIATANGTTPTTRNQHLGAAPNADIIVVATTFYDSDIIDALQYLDAKATAAGKPLVVNLSLGSQFGAHNASEPLDTAISIFTNYGNKAGRVVVAAAGNSGTNTNGIHLQSTLNENATNTINFTQAAYTFSNFPGSNYVYCQVWFDNADAVNATLTSPSGIVYSVNANGYGFAPNRSDGRIYIENRIQPNLNQRYITIAIDDSIPGAPELVATGSWQLQITNVPGGTGNLNYHVYRSLTSASLNGFNLIGGNGDYTIASPASSPYAIAVGGFMQRDSYMAWNGALNIGTNAPNDGGNMWIGSSRGPLRNNTIKPDITSVGFRQFAVAHKQGTPGGLTIVGKRHNARNGTSYASPTVAGGVALLLQQNPALTQIQAQTLIKNNAYTDAITTAIPNNTWGYGRFDAYKSMAKLIDNTSTQNRTIITNDTPAGLASESQKNIVGTEKIAVRFVAPHSGDVTGIFYKTTTTVPTLSDSVRVAIYSEVGGLPGVLMGAITTIAPKQISTNTWNFYHIYKNGYNVQAGQNYFVVMWLANAADALSLRTDTDGGTGNSLTFTGGAWVTQTFDYRLRPVVSGGDNVRIAAKILLQGCYNTTTALMNDNLRTNNYLPTTQPHTALGLAQVGTNNEATTATVLATTGASAIVDWVQITLRHPTTPSTIIATRSALLQRDGDVVDIDGVSPVQFTGINPGSYYVQLRHRNHLGVCSLLPIALNAQATIVNFRDGNAPTCGSNAQNIMGGRYVLISGDANHDKQVNAADFNTRWLPQNGQTYNYISRQADFNMDAQVNAADFNTQWLPNNSRQEQAP